MTVVVRNGSYSAMKSYDCYRGAGLNARTPTQAAQEQEQLQLDEEQSYE